MVEPEVAQVAAFQSPVTGGASAVLKAICTVSARVSMAVPGALRLIATSIGSVDRLEIVHVMSGI